MDDTDRKLLILLSGNPRLHFRQIASELRISRQAVHHRINALREAGVIQGSHAGVSVSYLDAVPVSVWGRSKTSSIEKTLDRLAESEFTRRVVVTGGNYLYVVGYLRNISELSGFAEFVKQIAEMPEPTVGIYSVDDGLMPYSVDGSGERKEIAKPLTPLDLKIIATLKGDARRPIADIAKMVGVSTKTVRRHMEKMISDGSIEMGMPMDLASGGDLLLVMHVNLKEGASKRTVGKRLLSKHYIRDQYVRTFSNLPNLLIWVFWCGSMAQIRTALRETDHDEDVESVMLNFSYLERIYPTWRDKLTPDLAPVSKKARTLKSCSRRKS